MPTPGGSGKVTVEEAASMLGLSRRQVRRLLRLGRIPGAAKIGGTWQMDSLSIQRYAAAGRAGHAPTGAPPAEPATPDSDAASALREETAARLRAEEALRIERQRFGRVLDMLPAYLVLLSPDYRVPFANRFFRERFGESNGERCFEYLFHRTEPCEECHTFRALTEMRPIRWEWEGPDGRLYDIRNFPFPDESGATLIMEVGIDVTEQKRAEAALRLAGAYNRSLIEASPDPLVTIGPDGKITDVNAATETATGRTRGELIGTDFFDYFTQPDRARAGYQQVFREGLVRDYPLEIRHRDGHTTPVLYNASVYRDDSGAVVGVFADARDVTEQRRAEEALRRANETLEDRVAERTAELKMINSALEEEVSERARAEADLAQERERLLVTLRSIGDGVIATDAQGRITLMNPVAEGMTGWREEEAIGRPLRSVFDIRRETTGELADDPVQRVLASGVIQGLANHTLLVSRDGTRRLLADSAAPIRTEDGAMSGVVLVFQDVTEKQRLEQELAKMNKLESLGILAGGIAHDFNNLLTGVLGNIALARMDVEGMPEVTEVLAEAEKASTRAKSLTQQLLTFAKGGDPVRRAVSLPELLREATAFNLRGSRCGAEFRLAPDLWEVRADPGQLAQVIQNLVINASDSMSAGGTVIVGADNTTVAADASLPLMPGDYVRVTVRDHGCGIPPHILPRVFDPYFSTKPGGSGIGLAVVYSVVVKHDGYVTVDSTPGEGTSFCVYLPSAHHAERRPDGPLASVPNTTRALVMDDEDTVLRVTKRMLERLGYEAVTAKHGSEAIDLFNQARRHGRPYDFVILDLYVTGGIGGKETLSRLRQIDPGVRAIVCSGYSSDPIMAQYAQHGFRAALDKPFALDSLQEAVDRATSG